MVIEIGSNLHSILQQILMLGAAMFAGYGLRWWFTRHEKKTVDFDKLKKKAAEKRESYLSFGRKPGDEGIMDPAFCGHAGTEPDGECECPEVCYCRVRGHCPKK